MNGVRAERVLVRGLVQGVGFRPFVCRLAGELGVAGWARNEPGGIVLHVEGDAATLDHFAAGLRSRRPPAACVESVERGPAAAEGYDTFVLRPSTGHGADEARVPPDRAVCPACLAEVRDRADRRHGYPFTTCTDCGPRFTVLEEMPCDRPNTSMARFPLCPECRREYEGPRSRRFHAQTIACPACGPQASFLDAAGHEQARGPAAVAQAAALLRAGGIVALKGLGGFQLLVRAEDDGAVRRLRLRKGRPTKPLAVMVGSADEAARLAVLSDAEHELLTGPGNPIVLARRRPGTGLADEVAPHLDQVGLLVATTPLHHLLLAEVAAPVVATSGNKSDEPICLEEAEALDRLGGVADGFLVHDRPVTRRADDSVFRVVDRPVPVRLARGYAPLPLPALERWARGRPPVLAVGGHQKVALALWTGRQAVLGPHIGDMEDLQTRLAFEESVRALPALYRCAPAALACDLHPDYYTGRWAERQGLPVLAVQHHHAHALSCMAEHDLLGRTVLAFTWDGTGYGTDGTVWGGEALRARADGFERVASLEPLPLPGGDAAVREPARVGLGLAAAALGVDAVCDDPFLLGRLGLASGTARVLGRMIGRGVRTAQASSVGRLFDGIAALALRAGKVSHEGEAAGWLEAVVDDDETGAYPLPEGDWRPLVRAVVDDLRAGVHAGVVAARFHNALADWARAVARRWPGLDVVLTGGCFVNARLLRRVRDTLEADGRQVYCHERVPPGDGGLAVGQLAAALTSGPR